MSLHRSTALAAIAFALATRAAGAQAPAPELPQVVVTGVGEVSVAPDRATLDVAVETRAATAAAAAADNARRVRRVLDTLKARGVAAGDLSTVGYSVHPDYERQPRTGTTTRRGYVATNVVRIEVRRIDEAGALLDAALGAGADRVNEMRFGSSRVEAMRDSALTLAVARARQSAEAMARAAGGRLGPMLELSSDMGAVAMRENLMMRNRAYAYGQGGVGVVAAQATTIAPDELTIRAGVVVRWRFEAGR